MSTRIEQINAEAMERYRAGVTIEMTHDGVIHTTLNGEHKVNDEQEFVAAVVKIFERNPQLRVAVWEEFGVR